MDCVDSYCLTSLVITLMSTHRYNQFLLGGGGFFWSADIDFNMNISHFKMYFTPNCVSHTYLSGLWSHICGLLLGVITRCDNNVQRCECMVSSDMINIKFLDKGWNVHCIYELKLVQGIVKKWISIWILFQVQSPEETGFVCGRTLMKW